MSPLSIKVILHEHPEYCGSWSPHALSGWYIWPSLVNCRCHQIWIPATNSVRIGQGVSWFPHKLIMPTATATDIIIATAKYLTAALRKINKNPILPPSYTITRKALFQLDSILSNASSAIKPQKNPTFKLPRMFTRKTHCCTSKGVSIHYTRFSQYLPYNTKTSQRSSSG